jgi:ABC-type lipoprotein export system ATPase subunit
MTEPTSEIIDLATAERQARTARPRYGDSALIVCDGLVKIYKVADLEVVALQGLDLLVESGEFIAMVGASGSGKSTLLNILGGLDVPSAGRAVVAGHELTRMSSREQTRYLRRVIGFVWQQTSRNLLPYLTAAENVALPMVLDGVGAGERRRIVLELLDQVGLADRADHRPDAMSGGEQQRVAIAVALANRPEVILADEPTGELDSKTGDEIYRILRSMQRSFQTTLVVVTHDRRFITPDDLVLEIQDGQLVKSGGTVASIAQPNGQGSGDHSSGNGDGETRSRGLGARTAE